MNRESLLSLPNLVPFEVEGSAALPNLPNLPNSKFGSQSDQMPSLLSPLFLELAPIKHTLRCEILDNITHLIDSKIRKMHVGGSYARSYGTENSMSLSTKFEFNIKIFTSEIESKFQWQVDHKP